MANGNEPVLQTLQSTIESTSWQGEVFCPGGLACRGGYHARRTAPVSGVLNTSLRYRQVAAYSSSSRCAWCDLLRQHQRSALVASICIGALYLRLLGQNCLIFPCVVGAPPNTIKDPLEVESFLSLYCRLAGAACTKSAAQNRASIIFRIIAWNVTASGLVS